MTFRKLLLGISNSLVSSELEQLKYLCPEDIPEGEAETIKYGFQLFAALERRGKLSEKNRDLLASLLGDIQRIDLKNKLLEIEGDQKMQLDGQSTRTTSTCTSAAVTGLSVINDSKVIDCHSDISSDDGVKIKDSENENPSSAIDKAAAGQYINDSEVIDYGIIKIKDNSENENPSSAIAKAAAGQYINDSEVIDCHSDIVSDDGIIKIKDNSENENPSSAIEKAAGQYINDSEVIDCHSDIVSDDGIIKIKDSENGNPSSAIEKAAAGQYINDSEVIDCHSDIGSDDGIIKIKDSENENSSSAIDKENVKDNGSNHHQMQLSVKFPFNEQPLSPNEFKDYLIYIVKSIIYNNYDLNDESDTFAKIFNSDEINKLSKIIAKKVMSNSKIYQNGKRTKHRSNKRRKVRLLKFFKNLLPNEQTTPLQDRGNTWAQQGMKRSDQSFIKMFYNLLIPKFGGVFHNIKFDCDGFLVWKNNNNRLTVEEYRTVINQITIKYIEYFCQLKKNAVFHDHYDDQWDEYKFDIKCCLLILEERLDWCSENILSDINGYTEWKYQIYVDISYAALSVVLAMILSKIDKGWKPPYISR